MLKVTICDIKTTVTQGCIYKMLTAPPLSLASLWGRYHIIIMDKSLKQTGWRGKWVWRQLEEEQENKRGLKGIEVKRVNMPQIWRDWCCVNVREGGRVWQKRDEQKQEAESWSLSWTSRINECGIVCSAEFLTVLDAWFVLVKLFYWVLINLLSQTISLRSLLFIMLDDQIWMDLNTQCAFSMSLKTW